MKMLMALCVTVGVMGIGAFDAAAAAKTAASIAAQSAAPLTTDELFRLYANRSWLWKDGAGYFPSKQRRFVAATGSSSKSSYGIGTWFLPGPGKLCFRASWYAKNGVAPALTCFSHRKKDGVVYQKREPDGEWYAFRNAPTRTSDEYRKLRPGDYVSTKLNKVKKRLHASN